MAPKNQILLRGIRLVPRTRLLTRITGISLCSWKLQIIILKNIKIYSPESAHSKTILRTRISLLTIISNQLTQKTQQSAHAEEASISLRRRSSNQLAQKKQQSACAEEASISFRRRSINQLPHIYWQEWGKGYKWEWCEESTWGYSEEWDSADPRNQSKVPWNPIRSLLPSQPLSRDWVGFTRESEGAK